MIEHKSNLRLGRIYLCWNLEDLEALEDLAVKAAMTYADIGTKYCNVEAVNYDDEIMGHENTGGPDSNARRNGTAQIILSEVAE